MAQAPPGPIVPPQQSQQSRQSQPPPPPPPARPKPQVQPRTNLAGNWKLNRDESDDPRTRLRDAQRDDGGRNSGGYPGGGYPGGGYPGGYPGGQGGGFPFPGSGGGGPYGGRGGGQDPEDNQRLQQLIQPASAFSIDLKDPEVDLTDDGSRELIFYTDGRKLKKSVDDSRQEIAAHWNGRQLVSDEKSPLGGKMNRTFELSSDGRQLYENLHIDSSRSRSPLDIRYVYDIPSSDAHLQSGPESDPDRPVLKRSPGADGAPSQ